MRPTQSSSESGVMERAKRLLAGRPAVLVAAVVVFYAVMAVVATWPFALHPGSTLTAPNWGDVASSVSKYEALREGHTNPLVSTHFPWIAYPQGPQDNVGVDRVSVFSTLYLWLVSDWLGAITAHSLLTFLGYILTATVMFWFVRKVTGSVLGGLIAGFIYGFWPQMYTLARADMTYTHMWLLILPLWAFWWLTARGYSKWRVVAATLSVVPAMFWTPYYALHVLVIGLSCLVVAAVYLALQRGWRKAATLGGAVGVFWVFLVLLYRHIGLHSPAVMVPARTLGDIYQESAQPLMYLLPGKFSWGPHGDSLLNWLVPRAAGISLYVGLSVLTLAVTGVVLMVRERRTRGSGGRRGHEVRVAAVMAGAAATVCFVFSLPPTYRVGGLSIPTPSLLIAHVEPALRAGQRFVMPLEGCLAVLAGIGAWMILKRFQPKTQLILAAGMMIVIGFDLWALPPEAATLIPTYPSLVALRALPQAPVAEFDNSTLVNQRLPCMFLHEYNKPLINDCGLGRSADLGVILTLPLCEQITALQAIGTRYIIVSPHDQAVLGCISNTGAQQRMAARDSTYEVVVLKKLSAGATATVKAGLQLP